VAGYTLSDQIRNTVIRNELNTLNSNNRILNNRPVGITMLKEWYLNAFKNTERKTDARSYVGKINLRSK
jgi:hypothetical protein